MAKAKADASGSGEVGAKRDEQDASRAEGAKTPSKLGALPREAKKDYPLPVARPLADWHRKTLEPWMLGWAAQGGIPSALLMTGPSGIGKRAMAFDLAAWALCASSPLNGVAGGAGPCGSCPSCRKAWSGNWVDFSEIRADSEDSARPVIRVDQIRELQGETGYGARAERHRFFLITEAHRLTSQAAAALLKVLEEPPAGWVIVLTADDPSLVLPTLVSRCQRIRLRGMPEDLLAQYLIEGGIDQERALAAARLAEGSWGKALWLSQDEAWDTESRVERFIDSPGVELASLLDWTSVEGSRLEALVDGLERACGRLVLGSVGAREERNGRHFSKALAKLGGMGAARRFWIDRADDLARARQELSAPLNRKLVAQSLLVPWLEV